MTTWFTSDQHFGHANIIGFCERPFTDVDEMNTEIARRWTEVVQPDDTVYVLGDYAMGRINETLAITRQLPGRKILLAGNHDRCFVDSSNPRLTWIGLYIEAGFAEIHQGTILVDVDGRTVRACHFPHLDTDAEYSPDRRDKFAKHRPIDDGDWLLHGHVHEKWQHRNRMINVGVDVWDFYPVSERELAGMMALEEARWHAEAEQVHRSEVMDASVRRL